MARGVVILASNGAVKTGRCSSRRQRAYWRMCQALQEEKCSPGLGPGTLIDPVSAMDAALMRECTLATGNRDSPEGDIVSGGT